MTAMYDCWLKNKSTSCRMNATHIYTHSKFYCKYKFFSFQIYFLHKKEFREPIWPFNALASLSRESCGSLAFNKAQNGRITNCNTASATTDRETTSAVSASPSHILLCANGSWLPAMRLCSCFSTSGCSAWLLRTCPRVFCVCAPGTCVCTAGLRPRMSFMFKCPFAHPDSSCMRNLSSLCCAVVSGSLGSESKLARNSFEKLGYLGYLPVCTT